MVDDGRLAPAGSAGTLGTTGLLLLLGRLREAEGQLAELTSRTHAAQELAGMADFDWHVPSGRYVWSDQLFSIFGYERDAVTPSQELLISHCHPTDRPQVVAAHERVMATAGPFALITRIVRLDEEVRHLAVHGEVALAADGSMERMRATCVDVTDRVVIEQAHADAAIRLSEARQRRRQASELNDSVVQGLVSAGYALELGDPVRARELMARTLMAARRIMSDLVEPLAGEELSGGDLTRASATVLPEPGVDRVDQLEPGED